MSNQQAPLPEHTLITNGTALMSALGRAPQLQAGTPSYGWAGSG